MYNRIRDGNGAPAMSLAFQCYAYAHGDAWHAICVDLDIAVDAPSRPAVEESLAIAIRMYLDRVSELPEEERSGFLTRRAPWRVQFGLAALTWIGRAFGAGELRRGFVFRPGAPAHS